MASADDRHGVFDSGKVYNQHAIARILGSYDYRWVIRNMIHAGLRYTKIGNQYFVSGHDINLWVQEGADLWDSATKSSDDQAEKTSSSDGLTNGSSAGGKKRSPSPVAAKLNK